MDADQFKLIDTAIGLIFVFLLVSICVTAAVEGVSSLLRLRSVNLVQGLIWILGDKPDPKAAQSVGFFSKAARWLIGHRNIDAPPTPVVGNEILASHPESLTRQVLEHPLINVLAVGNKAPPHIDPKLFSSAFIAVLNDAKNNRSPFDNLNAAFADVATLVNTVQNDKVRDSLAPAIAQAQAAVTTQEEKTKAALQAVEQWYDNAMSQASDWYKARMQFLTLLIAGALAVGFNIDSFRIAAALWSNEGLRQSYVAQASAAVGNPDFIKTVCPSAAPGDAAANCAGAQFDKAVNAMQQLNRLPVGWRLSDYVADAGKTPPAPAPAAATDKSGPGAEETARNTRSFLHILYHIPGWLVTVLAASLGAPFWFGTLQRVIPFRGGKSDAATK